MKKKIFFFSCLLTAIVSIIVYFSIFYKTENWAFVKSVGGIDIGTPYVKKDIWFLPVICDVSGLQEISSKPTLMNSALACAKVKSRVINDNIYLAVKTTLVTRKHKSSICGSAKLGRIRSGKYQVLYKGTDDKVKKISSIQIEP